MASLTSTKSPPSFPAKVSVSASKVSLKNMFGRSSHKNSTVEHTEPPIHKEEKGRRGGGVKVCEGGGQSGGDGHSCSRYQAEEFSVVVLGPAGVGKSALVTRFLADKFVGNYVPTVEDSHRHTVLGPDHVTYSIQIIDTAGAYDFPAMRNLWIKLGQAFILVFAVDNPASLDDVLRIAKEIAASKGDGLRQTPIFLVGNKSDNVMSVARADVKSRCQSELGAAAADNVEYMTTSAKSGRGVTDVFCNVYKRFMCVKEMYRPAIRIRSHSDVGMVSVASGEHVMAGHTHQNQLTVPCCGSPPGLPPGELGEELDVPLLRRRAHSMTTRLTRCEAQLTNVVVKSEDDISTLQQDS